MEQADQPILLVGNGVFVSRAQEAVSKLAETLQCPVIATPGGTSRLLDVLDITAPYASPAANCAIEEADVVLAIGTEIGEPLHYGSGRHWNAGNRDRKWIYVERDVSAFGVNRAIDVPLVGDLRDVVPQLQAVLDSKLIPARFPDTYQSLIQETRDGMVAVVEQAAPRPDDSSGPYGSGYCPRHARRSGAVPGWRDVLVPSSTVRRAI